MRSSFGRSEAGVRLRARFKVEGITLRPRSHPGGRASARAGGLSTSSPWTSTQPLPSLGNDHSDRPDALQALLAIPLSFLRVTLFVEGLPARRSTLRDRAPELTPARATSPSRSLPHPGPRARPCGS